MKPYTGIGGDIPDQCVIFLESFNALTAGDQWSTDWRDSASCYACEIADFVGLTEFHGQATSGQEKGGFTLKSIYNDFDALGVGWCVLAPPLVRNTSVCRR